MGYAMRITYRFTFAGKEYHGVNVTIGDTINENWFQEEAGKGKRNHKWSAISYTLPDVFDAIDMATGNEIEQFNPGDFGFRFSQLDKGE